MTTLHAKFVKLAGVNHSPHPLPATRISSTRSPFLNYPYKLNHSYTHLLPHSHSKGYSHSNFAQGRLSHMALQTAPYDPMPRDSVLRSWTLWYRNSYLGCCWAIVLWYCKWRLCHSNFGTQLLSQTFMTKVKTNLSPGKYYVSIVIASFPTHSENSQYYSCTTLVQTELPTFTLIHFSGLTFPVLQNELLLTSSSR